MKAESSKGIGGKPKAQDWVKVYLTADQAAHVLQQSKRLGLSASVYVRMLVCKDMPA
jgi:hypothetical protein